MLKGRVFFQVIAALAALSLVAWGQSTCSSFDDDRCASIYQFDTYCDAGALLDCPEESSDCFDCDPCHAFNVESCSVCVEKGCVWCGNDSLCSSPGLEATSDDFSKLTCSASNYVSSLDQCEAEESKNFFSDPLYDGQKWAIDLIRLEEVWELGYTGAGVAVRVNDDAVDSEHPEFAANFDEASCCSDYKPQTEEDTHGTSCASIIAAGADNGVCAVGIAPGASLSACSALDNSLEAVRTGALFLPVLGGRMDVSSNSYGNDGCSKKYQHDQDLLCPFQEGSDACFFCEGVDWSDPGSIGTECEDEVSAYCDSGANYEVDKEACSDYLDLFVECDYNAMETNSRNAIIQGVTQGRDGKGIVYVFASGNSYDAASNVNMEGALNSRFTIGVGAVGKSGKHSFYSTNGAALFVTAPGGDDLDFYTNHITALASIAGQGQCRSAGVGTSWAAPVVSGVVALMLEANPGLGWRDVQGVLASTSSKTDPDHTSWITNAAGVEHSDLYGFGLVDAKAAVDASLTWENLEAEDSVAMDSGEIDLPILDYPEPAASTSLSIDREQGNGFIIESVVVYLDLFHFSRGHLDIVLTSPQGTESLLHPGKRPEGGSYVSRWKLMTLKAWGENPSGEWKLSLVDRKAGDATEMGPCVDREYAVDIDGVELNCTAAEYNLCEDGSEGPFYEEIAAEYGISGLDDPSLADPISGETLDIACCECGGGNPPVDEEALLSWKLVVYGHYDEASSSGGKKKASSKGKKGSSKGKKGSSKGKKLTKGSKSKKKSALKSEKATKKKTDKGKKL